MGLTVRETLTRSTLIGAAQSSVSHPGRDDCKWRDKTVSVPTKNSRRMDGHRGHRSRSHEMPALAAPLHTAATMAGTAGTMSWGISFASSFWLSSRRHGLLPDRPHVCNVDGFDMMIDARRAVEIEASPVKMLGLAALGVLMTALSAVIALRAFPDLPPDGFEAE